MRLNRPYHDLLSLEFLGLCSVSHINEVSSRIFSAPVALNKKNDNTIKIWKYGTWFGGGLLAVFVLVAGIGFGIRTENVMSDVRDRAKEVRDQVKEVHERADSFNKDLPLMAELKSRLTANFSIAAEFPSTLAQITSRAFTL